MSRSILTKRVTGWRSLLVLCLGLVAATPAVAGPPGRDKSKSHTAASKDDQSPNVMQPNDVATAPYAVRLKITAYLARTHAREGNARRALIEFHSMLNVDDPSWPDNEEGDVLRIARDMEVSQMMAECGFYDHAVRVLETAMILAKVNKDPQAVAVERQIRATIQVAQAKGCVVPPVDFDGTSPLEMLAQAHQSEPATAVQTAAAQAQPGEPMENQPIAGETKPADSDESKPVAASESRVATAKRSAESAREPVELPELPAATSPRGSSKSVASAKQESAKASEEKFRLSKLFSSRSRNKTTEPVPDWIATGQPARRISPDLSPTYCPECAAAHAKNDPHVVPAGGVADRPTSSGLRSMPTNTDQTAVAPSEPARTPPAKEQGLLSRWFGRKKDSAPESPKRAVVASKPRLRSSVPVEAPVVSEVAEASSDPIAAPEDHRSVALTEHEPTASATSTTQNAIAEQPIEPEPVTRVEAAADETTRNVSTPSRADEPVARPTGRPQVGVAGQVANPGIFALEGTSTTLAALLRRSGGPMAKPGSHARIVRSVDLQQDRGADVPRKDFYCQRLDLSQPNGKALSTPVYGQEVVIVDGAGEKPLYVAVMPHFILQLPASEGGTVPARQIIDSLATHWPNIRQQEIGILRIDAWGRATKVAKIEDAEDASLNLALQSGDVLYIDGLSLDRSGVMAAAQAIAESVGARIRLPDASPAQ